MNSHEEGKGRRSLIRFIVQQLAETREEVSEV